MYDFRLRSRWKESNLLLRNNTSSSVERRQYYWHILEFSDYKGSDAGVKVKTFSTESSGTFVKVSIEISVDEIKTVDTETSQYQCRHENWLIGLFRIIETLKILIRD